MSQNAQEQSYEARCKARAFAIHQRLMNPKNAVEKPVRRLPPVIVQRPPKPDKKPGMQTINYSTALAIKEMYEAGVTVKKISAHFGIDKRTIGRIRAKYGWPVRERPKREAEDI